MSTATRPYDAMALLERGVPLSLLLDLALGPHSQELLDEERLPVPRPPGSHRSTC